MSQPAKSAKDIFLAALDTASDQRATLLDELCAGDGAMRRQVEALLRVHDEPDSLLDSPRIDLGLSDDDPPSLGPTPDQPITEAPGSLIGPYTLLRQIGEGGMGVVYMAQQTEPVERRVALKIIKPGMDTRRVIARFEAERHALAMMDHPNIARVLDAGSTDSGRPYFVMELVAGVSITQYCDEQHLTTQQRLELFSTVCHAIQHAHQKGIIHRDVKPTNVLVAEYDDRPVPKIIDFGVAKAIHQRLAERTVFTQFGQIVGTIDYMSPEQAQLNELDIDTRSDIYSLGVLLYELLTGETPFDRQRLHSAALDELLRIIREEEPLKPSQRLSTSEALPSIAAKRHTEPKKLSLLIRGELDWIVMKALEKDRARRYDTANGLASDIERYLHDEAVAACPPSAAYRFKKFARRNKTVLSTLALVAAALVLGIIGTSWQAIRATRAKQLAAERLVAEQRAGEATDRARQAEAEQRALAEQDRVRAETNRDRAEKNLGFANAEQQRAEGNLDLALRALDAVYLKAIGRDRLLGDPVARPDAAEPPETGQQTPLTNLERDLLKRGLDFYDQFAQKNQAAPRARLQTAQAYYRVGLLQGALGDPTAAAEAYRGALERFEQLTKEEPDNAEHFRGLGDVHRFLGYRLPDWNAAKKALQNSRLAYSRAIQLRPHDPTLYLSRGLALWALADDAAGQDFVKTVQLDPQNLEAIFLCSKFYKNDPQKGREYAERAVAIAPDDPRGHIALANVLGEIESGGLHPRVNAVQAVEHYTRAIELAPNSSETYGARGAFYFFHQDHQLALTDLNRALDLRPDDRYALRTRARVFTELGEYDKALADLAILAKSHPHWVSVHRVMGDVHRRKENWRAAVDAYAKVLEIAPKTWHVLKFRALAYAHLGQFAQALADLKQALELNPGETSTLGWVPPRLVAACPDPSVREELLKIADEAVERSPNRPRALQDRAALYLGLGQWRKAQGDLEKAVESETANHDVHYQHALLCLILKEPRKYHDACAAMLGKFGKSDDPMAANFAAWTCALAPDAVDDYKPVVGLATKAVEAQPDSDECVNTLGAILYRAGRHQAAIEWLAELDRPRENSAARGDSSPAYTWYFLAMAQKKAGNDEQARQYLNKANQGTDRELADEKNPPPWNRRATLELLRDEAKTLLAAPAAGARPSDQKGPQPTDDAGPSLSGPYGWVLHCRRARRFASEGNWTEAANAFSQAAKLRPNDWELWRACGEAHEKLNQWDEAMTDYRKAIELKPQQWRFWKTRAENLAQSEQGDKAIALYTGLIEHNPDNGELWKASGDVREKLDQWDEALADYQKAMALDPKQSPLWKTRAKRYAQSEQWDKAITLYTSLLQHSADDPELWQARAAAHAQRKQWDQAIADYGQVIRLRPEDTTAWRQRAQAHTQRKAYDQAVADYGELIRLKPDDAKAWGRRAQVYTSLGAHDKAIADYTEAIRLDPKNAWNYVGRAQAQSWKMENYDRAIADCTEAIRVDPKNSWAYAGRAEVYLKLRNYDQAIADCDQAIRPTVSPTAPPCLWAYVFRAEAHLAKGNHEQAIADYNEAIRLDPKEPHSYRFRAAGYLTLRRYEEALADCEKYVELAPDDATASLIRAQVLLTAGRTEEYRQACAQVLDRFGQSQDPWALCQAARACALARQAVPDPTAPVKLAQRAVSHDPKEWALYALAMAHLRAGQIEEAAQRFQESLRTAPSWDGRRLNWLGLALADHGRGKTQEARQWFGQATQLMEQHPAGLTQDRIEGQLLRREVQQLLGDSLQKKDGAQRGKEK